MLKDLIVVATSPGRENFAQESLKSLEQPALVISDFGYETGKLKWVAENINCERILFIQDTVVAISPELVRQAFLVPGSVCLNCDPNHFGSFLGIFETDILRKMPLVDSISKEESIRFERDWTQLYLWHCKLFSHFGEKMSFRKARNEISTGKEVLILESDVFRKIKTNWGQLPSKLNSEHSALDSITKPPKDEGLELLNLRHDLETLIAQAKEREELIKEMTRREMSASLSSHIKIHFLDFMRFLKLRFRGLI